MLHCKPVMVCITAHFCLYIVDFLDDQAVSIHSKPDVKSCEGQTVDSVRLSLITGSGIVGKHAYGGL